MNKTEYKTILEATQHFIDTNFKDVQSKIIANNVFSAIVKKEAAQEFSDKERFLTWSIANSAYGIILNENVTAKEALVKASEVYGAEIEKVLAEKSKQSGKLAGSIVKNNDDHPVQMDMVKKKVMNRQALKNSKNVWQMLNLLVNFKEYYKSLLDLEDAIRRISILELNDEKKQKSIEKLQEDVVNLKSVVGIEETKKEKAERMVSQGMTREFIAETLGVNVRTIRRWLND